MKNNYNIQHNLLTYIAYCLPRRQAGLPNRRFSYQECFKAFEHLDIKTTIKTLRKEFSVCKKEGLIEYKTYYRRKYPTLTFKGKLEIKTRLPLRRFDWDKKWRLVIFDIPESWRKERLALQKNLKNLGFGKISRGVYLSSRPLFTSVKRSVNQAIRDRLIFIESEKIEDEKRKVARAWHLQNINESYEKFIQKAKVASFWREKYWPLKAKKLEKEFENIYEVDPHLPEEFLPANWHGQEAYGIFKAISNSY